MASRRRMIHDGIFSSGDLVDLPAAARWMWLGMIVYASDEGVIRNHIGFFQHTLLAGLRVSRKRIETWLQLFVSRRMLTACNLNDVSCYRVTNFFRFQKLKRHEIENKDLQLRECTQTSKNGCLPARIRMPSGHHQDTIRHPSSNLEVITPDAANAEGAITRGKGREGNRREGKGTRAREDAAAVFQNDPPENPEDRHRELVEQLQAASGQVVRWKDGDWTIGFCGISNGSGAVLFHSMEVADLEILVELT